MSEAPATPYDQSAELRAAQAKARAWASIDAAIATLKIHWHQHTWEQEKAIKKIIYTLGEVEPES